MRKSRKLVEFVHLDVKLKVKKNPYDTDGYFPNEPARYFAEMIRALATFGSSYDVTVASIKVKR